MAAWLARLVSSCAARQPSSLPAAVASLLASHPHLTIAQVPGAGRGLVAAQAIEQGALVLEERAWLAAPAAAKRRSVCWACLRPLAGLPADAVLWRSSRPFCSSGCLQEASRAWFAFEQQCDAAPLQSYCDASGERFPLLAARLAFRVAQAALESAEQAQPQPHQHQQPHQQQPANTAGAPGLAQSSSLGKGSRGVATTACLNRRSRSNSSSRPSSHGRHSSSLASLQQQQQQLLGPELAWLVHARVPPPPPPPWVEAHALLCEALQCGARKLRGDAAQAALASALQRLDLDWFSGVLARLHLNTFRVELLAELDLSRGHAGLAALLGGGGTSGSALFLLASLFNHSCEPNIDVSFPHTADARFTAARRIEAGEQLCISYVDAQLEVSQRREWLHFAYGFTCQCQRCADELAGQA